MIKQVLKNSFTYKNNNNVWVIYEYLGNNSFTDNELLELSDFLSQNNMFSEFIIVNYKWVKKYYISFYLWEVWWANNFNNYNSKTFFDRYNYMINIKPKIEKLSIFEDGARIRETDLKIYNLEKEKESDYRKDLLKTLKYKREPVRNYLLKENFSIYMRNMLSGTDYQRYIFNNEFHNNINYEFNSLEQEIFDVWLKFMTWSKYFIFPFYLKWKEQKSWDFTYQELDFNEITSWFLDKNIITEKEQKWRDILAYVYKISLKPTQVAADIKNNKVVLEWNSTSFDLESVNDKRNLFFEFQNSVFLYTKRPDIQRIIKDFDMKLWTKLELIQSDIPKDFNPQYLSHNKFSDAYHVWHLRNLSSILWALKEYYPEKDNGMLLWREYFSNNFFKFNFFDMAWKDPEWNLTINANWIINWTSWAWKTYIAMERLFKQNNKDQVLVFDNLWNFAKMYNKLSIEEKSKVNLLEYWYKFPNFIWKLKMENLSIKQDLLYKIILWVKSDLISENKEMIRAIINNYLKNNVGWYFKLSLFREYIENKSINDSFSVDNKRLILHKIDWMNSILWTILDNENDFNSEILKNQKVILSYWELMNSPDPDFKYFMLEIILKLVQWYLAFKNEISDENVSERYTMTLFDEAHNVIWKNTALDEIFKSFVKEIRNYKANIILITQLYDDIPAYLRNIMNFFIILDPLNWESFKKDSMIAKKDNDNWVENTWKRNIIFNNFEAPLARIIEEYQRDAKLVNEEKIEPKDALRFCIFWYKYTDSYYILNTKL